MRRLSDSTIRKINIFLLVVCILYMFAQQMSHPLGQREFSVDNLKDYTTNLVYSRMVVERQRFMWYFNYPPPHVVMRLAWPFAEHPAGAALWTAVLLACGAGCVFMGLRLCLARRHRYRFVIVFLAFMATTYFWEWEMQTLNCNAVFMALYFGFLLCWLNAEKGARFVWAGGMLLAASIALKMYSLAFIPYLVYKREWRILGAAGIGLAVFFIAVPYLYFGRELFVTLYASWFEHFSGASAMELMDKRGHLSFNLFRGLDDIREKFGASAGFLGTMSKQAMYDAWRVLRWLWVAGVASYFLWDIKDFFNFRRKPPVDTAVVCLDASMLMLGATAISPTFHSSQGLMIWIPVLLAARLVFWEQGGRRLNILALLFLAFMFLGTHQTPPGDYKAIPVNIIMISLFGLVYIMRRGSGPAGPVRPGMNAEPAAERSVRW